MGGGPSSLTRGVQARLEKWVRIGAPAEVQEYLRTGVKVEFTSGREPPPIKGREVQMSPEQLGWWRGSSAAPGERGRLMEKGAWEPAPSGEHRWLSGAFLVPKGDGGWRLVINLSRLNTWVRKKRCRFETLKQLRHIARKGDWMISWDISDGFYHVPIHPDHRKYFRFLVDGEVLQMRSLPMGYCNSPQIFTKVMRVVVAALRGGSLAARAASERPGSYQAAGGYQGGDPPPAPTSGAAPRGAQPRNGSRKRRRGRNRVKLRLLEEQGIDLLPYLDDFVAFFRTREEAIAGAERVQRLLRSLGLLVKDEKCVWTPTQSLKHLGLQVDTAQGVFMVTPERIQQLEGGARRLGCAAAANRRLVPARMLASFAGLAESSYLAVPLARFYLRELYWSLGDVSRTRLGWEGNVRLTKGALRDLKFWEKFSLATRYNGRAIWRTPTTATLHCDAARDGQGRGGWGGVLDGTVPARGFWRREQQQLHITHLELLAVRYSVESFLTELRGKVVRLYEDNTGVVSFLTRYSTRSPQIMRDLRKLLYILDSNDISLQAEYIRSADNVYADRLSRWWDSGDWELTEWLFQEYEARFGPHTLDGFATGNNCKVRRYWSAARDPGCLGVDALSQDGWAAENLWLNPPWNLIMECLRKLAATGGSATVVVPAWPSAPWWPLLMRLASQFDIHPAGPGLFSPGRAGGSGRAAPPSWNVAIVRVEGHHRGSHP